MIRVNLLQPKGTPIAGFGLITIGILVSSQKPFPQFAARSRFPQKLFSATLRNRVEGSPGCEGRVRLFAPGD